MGLVPHNRDYARVMADWTKCNLPTKFTEQRRFYDYYVNYPIDDVMEWLEDHCEGEYKMNVYFVEPIIYFMHEAVAIHFKLVWCYE
jgi:hypothetical protein